MAAFCCLLGAGVFGDPAKPGGISVTNADRSAEGADVAKAPGDLLTPTEKNLLLELARGTILARLRDRKLPQLPVGPAVFGRKLGCFVTLEKEGDLRGCIGNIWPAHPLAEAVQQNAVSAAFRDPRFPPVRDEEMSAIKIEISVLTEPRPLTYTSGADLLDKLKPGVHGVVISQGFRRRSTYLPQVWEQIPDKQQFLSLLCRKGGMAIDAWRDPAKTKVDVYEAFVFGEAHE
jgi:AmmeMemoRadiSam system protein A